MTAVIGKCRWCGGQDGRREGQRRRERRVKQRTSQYLKVGPGEEVVCQRANGVKKAGKNLWATSTQYMDHLPQAPRSPSQGAITITLTVHVKSELSLRDEMMSRKVIRTHGSGGGRCTAQAVGFLIPASDPLLTLNVRDAACEPWCCS